jgi:predicted transcriptional regulator
MLIKEIMNTAVCECPEDTPLNDVYELIQSCPNRYVVVTDSPQHRVPLGVVNEHSICELLVKNRRRDRDLYAGSLMNTRIQKISEDTDVSDCKWLLRRNHSSRACVDFCRYARAGNSGFG